MNNVPKLGHGKFSLYVWHGLATSRVDPGGRKRAPARPLGSTALPAQGSADTNDINGLAVLAQSRGVMRQRCEALV